MTEERFELRPYGVKKVCECGGEMVADGGPGAMVLSDPPKFRHTCSKCGAHAEYADKYPTVRWEAV